MLKWSVSSVSTVSQECAQVDVDNTDLSERDKLTEEEDEDLDNDKENKENLNPLFRLQLGNKSKCESFALLKEYVDMGKAQDLNEFTKIVPLQDRV